LAGAIRKALLQKGFRLYQLATEVKKRTKVVEVFCDGVAVKKFRYMVLSQLDETRGRAGSEDLWKSIWEVAMPTRHNKRYTNVP